MLPPRSCLVPRMSFTETMDKYLHKIPKEKRQSNDTEAKDCSAKRTVRRCIGDVVTDSTLTKGQQKVIDVVRAGSSVFCTGPAGTGKSHVIKTVRAMFRVKGQTCVVTATTGPAAVLVGGATLHSTLGLGSGELSIESHLRIIRRNGLAMKAWKVQSLIIDEISMLSEELFDKMDAVARVLRRKPNEFFGGMQLITFGDFFQLPPVNGRFVFHSEAWKNGIQNVIVLSENMRQTSGSEFEQCLNQIRVGIVNPDVHAFLQSRTELVIGIEERKKAKQREMQSHEECGSSEKACVQEDANTEFSTEINAINSIADGINARAYEKLDRGDERAFQRSHHLHYQEYESVMQSALNKTTMPEELRLVVGCKVMLLKNLNVNARLCNGTRGTVVGFSKEGGWPIVRFEAGAGRGLEGTVGGGVIIPPHTNETFHPTSEDILLFSITQIPLRLAWGLTIHKAQGITLERVTVNLEKTFVAGQAYVAISRCRHANQLVIRNLNIRHIFAHPEVIRYYQSIEPNIEPNDEK